MEENNKLVRSLNSSHAVRHMKSNEEKGALQLNSNTDSFSQARPGPPASKDA